MLRDLAPLGLRMRSMGYHILFLGVCLVVLYVVQEAQSHQQCLDSLPPFKPREQPFCQQYEHLSCCSEADDLRLQKRYTEVINALEKDQGVLGCRDMLQQIVCLECHPFSYHLYEAELSRSKKSFPGLCGVFCKEFYDACSQAIGMLTEDEETKAAAATSQSEFCMHIAAEDAQHCYPELDNNPALQYNVSREGETVDGCVCLEEIATQLRNPIQLQEAPDGTGRLFIAEQLGILHIYHHNKSREPTPFMNLSHAVHLSSAVADEKGFLSFVFHPKYAENRRFFVYYFAYTEGAGATRLSEFLADANDPNKVDEDSERVLLNISQPHDNHNGGWLGFDPDGYLYLSLGDGGQQGDLYNYAQDLTSLHGKLLRIDVDSTPAEGEAYVIPPDNPFQNVHNGRPEIFAYGFRSNWRCDIDDAGEPESGDGKGRLFCSDNGQSTMEEINLIVPGGNYGWNVREGLACYEDNELCDQLDNEQLPIHVYDRSKGMSIISGPLYRGCLNPALRGRLVFGDFVVGSMWTLGQSEVNGKWKSADLKTCGPDLCHSGLTGTYPKNIFSFGEDYGGEVYMLTTEYGSSEVAAGKVFKIVNPRMRGDPSSCRSYKPADDDKEEDQGGKPNSAAKRSMHALQGFMVTSLLTLALLF